MTVKQISVFLENKPNQLAEFVKVLNENHIDMRAMSVADTKDFGILRVIVDDTYKTACVLKDAGYVCSITPVLAVAIPDEPGGLTKLLTILGDNGVNLEYTYAFITRQKDTAYMIFRVEDNNAAAEALASRGIKTLEEADIQRM